jgi:N-acetylglucosamine-6-sulfatase
MGVAQARCGGARARRRLACWAVAVAASTLSACGGGGGTAPDPVPSPTPIVKPNIILVVLDDLDASTEATMPRLKSLLADQGVAFTNTMMAMPLCAPNRATIFTGQFPHNHGVTDQAGAQGLQPLESNLLPVWLKQAGYRTGLAGKYINQYPTGAETSIPPGWDDWHGVLEDRTATSYDYWINDNGVVSYPETYQTDLLTQRAVDFLNRSGSSPFFLVVAPGAPHSPAEPADRHFGSYAGAGAPRTADFNEEDMSDKPRWLRGLRLLTDQQIYEIDKLYSRRLESLMAVEDMVDRILQTLTTNQQLSRTWIFFTTDNGVFTGQHRMPGGKAAVYDPASRVPLLVRGPGVPAGRVLPHLVGTVDLAATFLALAGQSADSLDGKSLVPLLGSSPTPAEQWRREILVESFIVRSPVLIPEYSSIRTDRYTFVDIPGYEEQELYDLAADPYQTQNLVRTDPAAAQPIVATLQPRLDALRRCRAASCR